MPILKLLNDGSETNVETGSELQDIVDKHGVSIPFGCRAGACGTCRIRIVENPQNVTPASDDEKFFLENFCKAPADNRLACQIKVLGDVTVEVVDSGNFNHNKKG